MLLSSGPEFHREQVPEGERLKGIGFPLWEPRTGDTQGNDSPVLPNFSAQTQGNPKNKPILPTLFIFQEGRAAEPGARTQTVTHSESGLTSPSQPFYPPCPANEPVCRVPPLSQRLPQSLITRSPLASPGPSSKGSVHGGWTLDPLMPFTVPAPYPFLCPPLLLLVAVLTQVKFLPRQEWKHCKGSLVPLFG